MPRKSAIENTAVHDEMLAVLVIIVGTVGGLIAGAAFLRDTMALSGPRPQRPWDQ